MTVAGKLKGGKERVRIALAHEGVIEAHHLDNARVAVARPRSSTQFLSCRAKQKQSLHTPYGDNWGLTEGLEILG